MGSNGEEPLNCGFWEAFASLLADRGRMTGKREVIPREGLPATLPESSHPRVTSCTVYNCAQRMALISGTKLGSYEIQSPLGAGGMGAVYRARDTRLDRTVAIKLLPNHLSSNPDLKQRFEREARASRR
jgi:serine/threonine protein kinase